LKLITASVGKLTLNCFHIYTCYYTSTRFLSLDILPGFLTNEGVFVVFLDARVSLLLYVLHQRILYCT